MAESRSSGASTNTTRIVQDRRFGVSLAGIVALAVLISSCGDQEVTQVSAHARPPSTSVPSTSAPATSAPATTQATMTAPATSASTTTAPGASDYPSDGGKVIEPDVDAAASGVTGPAGPFENHIFGVVDRLWRELDLPVPQLPETPGLVWHVVSSRPVGSSETTLYPWHAVATVGWEDVYGLFDFDCSQPEPCTTSPFPSFNPGRGIWTVTAPGSGRLLAELTMEISGPTIVFSDETTGEEVHRIVAESPDQAEFVAKQMKLPYSIYVEGLFHTGVWVRHPEGNFELQPVPWTRPPRSIVALPSGGFAAFQNTQRDGYTPGDSRVWTSPDGLTWVDHGRPTFLAKDSGRFHVDRRGDELQAEVVLSLRTMTVERYTSRDGLTWTRR